jgi:Protein of unknown function (DUF998)
MSADQAARSAGARSAGARSAGARWAGAGWAGGLVAGGAVAGPLWLVVTGAQAASRAGYDITRHPASVLSNGDLGWIQITNFLAAGLLTLAAAFGVRRLIGAGWVPILLAVQGIGLVAAGAFRLDPVDGFPPGTPAGVPATMSWHSVLHNVAGSCSFAAMLVLCFVLGRRFARAGQGGWARSGWAWSGWAAGVVFLAGLGWAFGGGKAGALTLFVGVGIAWLWIATVFVRILQGRGLR